MDGLIARLPELDALGVGVVLVGSGPPAALVAFGRDMALARRGVTVITDPSLTAFRAAELRRPRFHGLRAAVEALRELAAGYPPGRVIGDARQLGGAFLVDESGRVIYHHRGRSPGDLVDSSDIVQAALALFVEQRRSREARLMEIWFHLANVLYVVSYLVTDILWLRALAVLGGLSSLTWTLTTPTPSLTFIGWTLVYNTINMVQIGRLWQERRPVRLAPEKQMLYAAAFRTLTPREFQRLLAVGRWQEAPAKAVLIDQGASPGRMLVLASGRTAVKVDGREVATLRLGQFAGEMSFLTGARTTAAVKVVEPARFVSWATDDLERFLGKHPELRAALQLVLGRDLAAKLVGERERT